MCGLGVSVSDGLLLDGAPSENRRFLFSFGPPVFDNHLVDSLLFPQCRPLFLLAFIVRPSLLKMNSSRFFFSQRENIQMTVDSRKINSRLDVEATNVIAFGDKKTYWYLLVGNIGLRMFFVHF